MCYEFEVVSPCQHYGDFGGQRATTRAMGGNEETPLSAIRPCGMEVPPNRALDTNGSPHLIIDYLLRNE